MDDAIHIAANMSLRELEKHCARSAAKAGKFLASARAILEADLPYFLELRQRLNAQGQRRFDTEGWARWCEKHFSCDVRTVNRNLAILLGPEVERKKSRKWRPVTEALAAALDPAMRLVQKHKDDPDASEFLDLLQAEELDGMVQMPPPRPASYPEELERARRKLQDELYRMGLHLAQVIVDAPDAVGGETDEGKKILGIARKMIQRKAKDLKAEVALAVSLGRTPQDKASRSGNGFVIEDLEVEKPNKAKGAVN